MELNSQHQEQTALLLRKNPGNHWIARWEGPIVSWDGLENRNIFLPCNNSNPVSSNHPEPPCSDSNFPLHSVASHKTRKLNVCTIQFI
jgi:hypothetical protein